MAVLSELINLQLQMFVLIIVGVILQKSGILGKNGRTVLTDVLLYFILPCNIIKSFQMEFSGEMFLRFALVFLASVLIQVISFTFSRILYRREPQRHRKVLQYVTIVSNGGFLGLPVTEEVFGAEGLMYASIFLIPMRIMMWTSGISCFTGESDKKEAFKKVLRHPCIVAVYIGLFLLVSQLTLPVFLQKTISGAGGATTTISMIVIGAIMSEVDMRELIDIQVCKCVLVRLIILPLCALVLTKIMHMNALLAGVTVVLTAMPAGSTAPMLAAKYDGDYIFASKCVVVTTVLSLLTIPIWTMIV